ncbi:peptidylprolyl isomerase [Natronoflexus pectinivorans]|nr:peptidylprolyl isomerase [Natronoflexus pectinivorans]
MKKILFSISLLALLQFFAFCQTSEGTHVILETEYGNLVIKLYDETPVHRDNFLKLVEEGYYEGLLFHRVINEFMIQAGDPGSRDAMPNAMLGGGGVDYKLDAEIMYPQLFHKKGALAAARQGDQVNPEKKSSGSQFYIVHGKVYSNEELDEMEHFMNERKSQQVFMKYAEPYRNEIMQFQQTGDREGFERLMMEISEEAGPEIEALPRIEIPQELREAYTTIGGVPHLDGEYTVFGEVVKGLEIIDKIAKVEVNQHDRPVEDIKLNIRIK